MNVASAVEEAAMNADFFDEKGLLKEYQSKQMNVLLGRSHNKPIMIEFGCGLTPPSFNRKLILQADTGAYANAINKKTFDELFPDVELGESTFCLQNFDKRLIKPNRSFRYLLRWKGHKYRVRIRVMGIDTPNLLSRKSAFLMGIPEKCLQLKRCQLIRQVHKEYKKLMQTILFQFQIQTKDIQFHPRKEYFAIQIHQWKRIYPAIQFCPWKKDLR